MGWRESPPHFSTTTETVADLANAAIAANAPTQPHRLDQVSETTIKTTASEQSQPSTPDTKGNPLPQPKWSTSEGVRLFTRPTACWDVCVDDFIGLCQGGLHRKRTIK